jgi:MoxR-like ATPase
MKTQEFTLVKGPVFTTFLLADEINRASPKTQSALLEAMQEHRVTSLGERHALPEPFFVMATQNPIELEGTYPLPEAQVDRFMLKVTVSYPTKSQELEVMRRMSNMTFNKDVNTILTKEEIFSIRDQVNQVEISESLERYIIELVYATRSPLDYGLKQEAEYIQYGVSPRASINLNLGAKAVAYMEGRDYVLPEDIKEIAYDVMNHRILLNYEAEADGVTTKDIIEKILKQVPIG